MRLQYLSLIAALMLVMSFGSALLADHHLAGEAADNTLTDAEKEAGWVLMFNGTDLSGWKSSTDNPQSFKVEDGELIANGEPCHLFYGENGDASIKDFEFQADVYCVGKSNSGIYMHTQYQADGWPNKGFECQVANGYGDPRKTASIYGFADLRESPAKDDEWFHYHIKVEGKNVKIWINGELAQDWTQPADWDNQDRTMDKPGTFAIQAHDPGSKVRYKNMKLLVAGDE